MQNLRNILPKQALPDVPTNGLDPDLLSIEAFRHEIEREILRSDRTGGPLTLLVFDVRAQFRTTEERHVAMNALAQAVTKCSRRTDSRGWHQQGEQVSVGLLLHNTFADKALRLIQTIRTCLEEEMESVAADGWPKEVSCEIYVYPVDQTSMEDRERNLEETFLESDQGPAIAMHDSRRLNELIGHPLPRWKRALDVLVSGLGLIMLSPLLVFIALGIKLTSPGPVFFKQVRIGYLGKPFLFWKFRTMVHNYNPEEHKAHLEQLICSDASEKPMLKLDKRNRAITPFGRLLRVSSLDELPQLINVLRGEMSLIGPRPCLSYEAEKYLCWHSRRFDIMPGMTGLWQVRGKNRLTFKEMIRLDIEYARNCSLALDLQILLMTVPTVWSDIRQGLALRQMAEVRNVR